VKRERHTLANELDLDIVVRHLLPSQQVNKIEHRLFAFIIQNWRAQPLVISGIVELILSHDHENRLTVPCDSTLADTLA